MPNTPNPTEDAKAAFEAGWTNFMAAHNQPKRDSYANSQAEPAKAILNSAYEKFLKGAEFPNPYTTHILLSGFSQAETTAVLYYLDKTGVHSTIEWSNIPNTPQIAIRDGNNGHLGASPVQIIRDQQTRLSALHPDIELPDDEPPVAQQQGKTSYIPPFNIQITSNGSYILLDHMHHEDVGLLSKALTSRNIKFTERDSESSGKVFVVPFNMDQFEELGRMMEEARTPENNDKAPENARIYRPAKGDPAISVLDASGEKHIPLDGMMPAQTMALEARLNKSEIPFTIKMKTAHGPVFAVPEKEEDKLEALRFQLRQEHNARKAAASTPAGPFASKDYV